MLEISLVIMTLKHSWIRFTVLNISVNDISKLMRVFFVKAKLKRICSFNFFIK